MRVAARLRAERVRDDSWWLDRVLWAAAAVTAAIQVVGALIRPLHDRLADLHVYRGAVRLLLDGGSLYDYATPGSGAPFTYPPFAGIVFTPLALVPESLLRVLWTAVTLAVIAALARLAVRADGIRHLARATAVPLITLLLLLSTPGSSNIRFGQVSVLLVVLVVADALRAVPERFSGVATGMAAALKLTPLIFIPYWWFSRRRRTAVTATGTFVLCTAMGWLLLPRDSRRFWFTELENVDRVGNIATHGNQSLNGALLRLGVEQHPRSMICALLGLLVVTVALWRAVRAHHRGEPFTAVVVVGAAGLVVSPVSWTHHQVWLVLAALLAVSRRRRNNIIWFGAVAALMILPVVTVATGLPGGTVADNARLLLALSVACLMPLRATSASGAPGLDASRSADSPA